MKAGLVKLKGFSGRSTFVRGPAPKAKAANLQAPQGTARAESPFKAKVKGAVARLGAAVTGTAGKALTGGPQAAKAKAISGPAPRREDAPTVSPVRNVGDAFTQGTQAWGNTTAKMGRAPNLSRLPNHVLSTNQEVARGPQRAQFEAVRAGLEQRYGRIHTDLDVHSRNYSTQGNLDRYRGRVVHVFVPENGLRLHGPDGSPTTTKKEMDVARRVEFHGPGVQNVGGKPQIANRLGPAPETPRTPDTARQGLERAGAGLNAGGFLFAAGNAIANAPRQVGETFNSLRNGDVAGALHSGGQVAQHAANLVATGAQVVADFGQRVVPSVARTAGRFVPGANVAIAALDTAQAVRSWSDPNTSIGKKWGDSITAAGSVVAALPIPGASLVGGGIATVSSFLTGWLAPK
ncbi:hypothetical protein [Hyalangium rubrum]|uniref:Uncharacterized protein n=1 Tax=Hyalangium rubrum TaxID=3103134 RepID=A0ABU5H0R5_9BACT|nr:hypothetical protein [Hyalangium sp. s54d21]MDY7227048.1 hypothetical protein [Hyalangium sp. s54d21]